MRTRSVTFVGGPEDGKQIATRFPGDRYKVAVLPPLPAYIPVEENPEPTITFEQFVYEIEKLPGENWVAYPAEWRDNPHIYYLERVMTALLRGYVGRP